jgi:steroid delta-isomerase-like uncharacterized protein
MSVTTDVAAMVRAAHEAFNLRDFARSRELTASDCIMTIIATGQELHGPDGMIQYLEGWVSAFPDAHTTVSNIIVDGQRVAIEFRGQGTHTGVFQTPMGDISPTGKSIDVPFCEVWEVVDGKITSAHSYFDAATFMRQIGIME